jgi:hypothetical protein
LEVICAGYATLRNYVASITVTLAIRENWQAGRRSGITADVSGSGVLLKGAARLALGSSTIGITVITAWHEEGTRSASTGSIGILVRIGITADIPRKFKSISCVASLADAGYWASQAPI